MSTVDINELQQRDEVVSNSKAKDRASLLQCRRDNMSSVKKRNYRDADKPFQRSLCPELYDYEEYLPQPCGTNFTPSTCRQDVQEDSSIMEAVDAVEIDNMEMISSIIEEFIDGAMARADDDVV